MSNQKQEQDKKTDPCPFCGKEVVVGFSENIHKEKYRQVWCSDGERCGYECVMKKTEEEAIAAHNRVCRAVEAAEKQSVTDCNHLGNAAKMREARCHSNWRCDMIDKQWEFTGETKIRFGITLKRIRAAVGFRLKCGIVISKGELGGWIEKESNLSGNAWVSGNALVCGDARVSGDARVYGNAWVYGNARVSDNAWVFDNAWVSGSARVSGNACVSGNASVKSSEDYCVFKNAWSSFRWFTYTRSNKMWSVGCFYGTGAELIAKAYKDSEKSGKCYEAVVKAQEEIEKVMEV